jgi:hypothetical protein
VEGLAVQLTAIQWAVVAQQVAPVLRVLNRQAGSRAVVAAEATQTIRLLAALEARAVLVVVAVAAVAPLLTASTRVPVARAAQVMPVFIAGKEQKCQTDTQLLRTGW